MWSVDNTLLNHDRSIRSEQVFLLQSLPSRSVLTAVAFYLLPLAQRNVFHSRRVLLGAVYVSFPMGLLLYGWNDIVDCEATA